MTRSWFSSLLVAALMLGAVPIRADDPAVRDSPAAKDAPAASDAPAIADLDGDPSLSATLMVREGQKLPNLFAAARTTSGKAFIVLGKIAIPPKQLEALNDQPVRSFLAAVADATGSPWRKYRGFYLLYPNKSERHGAKPVRRDKLYPELDAKIKGTYEGPVFNVALQRLGAAHHLQLLVLGIGGTPSAFDRNFKPTIIAAEGKRVEELCWALTRIFGDPWDHLGRAHVLVLAGRELTADERRRSLSSVAISEFANSLTAAQQQQMASPEGLGYLQLSPAQRLTLAAATSTFRAGGGFGPDQIILRRIGSGGGRLSDDIDVYAAEGGGLRSLGSMVAPLPER